MERKIATTLLYILITLNGLIAQQPQAGTCGVSVSPGLWEFYTLYIGMDNPVYVHVDGIPDDSLVVTCAKGSVKRERCGLYFIKPETIGEVFIQVSDNNGRVFGNSGKFYIKRLPEPVPLLGANYFEENLKADVFKAQGGIAAVPPESRGSFCYSCNVGRYFITRVSKTGNRQTLKNKGAKLERQASAIIQRASAGDIYIFSDIQAKCPGDDAWRTLRSLVFFIQ